MRAPLELLIATAGCCLAGPARADSSATALDELKQGYALKQVGNCRDALPHFARSFEVDPKPKAALNLADCEARTGDSVGAQGHAAEGQRLARDQKDAELAAVADQLFADVAKRLPHLTIELASGAPLDSTVSLDGHTLSASSLHAALPVNAGVHHIVVFAGGFRKTATEVRIEEGAASVVQVAPGAWAEPSSAVTVPSSGLFSHLDSQRTIALGVGAVGIVGLAIGIGTGLASASKHGALEGECAGNNCPSSAQGDLGGFHSLKTFSTVFYAIGLLSIAGGAALWLTAPKASPERPDARLWIGPTSAVVAGSF